MHACKLSLAACMLRLREVCKNRGIFIGVHCSANAFFEFQAFRFGLRPLPRAPAGLIAHAALFALQLRLIMNLLQLVQALLQAKEMESNRLSLYLFCATERGQQSYESNRQDSAWSCPSDFTK